MNIEWKDDLATVGPWTLEVYPGGEWDLFDGSGETIDGGFRPGAARKAAEAAVRRLAREGAEALAALEASDGE